jgi:hypothetical protein
MRFAMPLRILHVLALATAALSFIVGGLGWLQSHQGGAIAGKDFVSFGGLATGFGLGVVLLWRALRSVRESLKVTVALYACWIGVFAWYWFGRFASAELHTLDPNKIEPEHIRQTIISATVFLTWVCLVAVGPALRARKLR